MYLGLDLGTSGLKAVLMNAEQEIVATAHAPLEESRPQSGWSEQDPMQWIAAAETVFDQLKAKAAPQLAAVKGIGLSGQMHGATMLDAQDKPVYPCILWNDTRSHEEAAELDSIPSFRSASGSIVFPGFTAPKLLWMRRNKPGLFAKVRRVLLPKDYLRLWLTGEAVSEMSDASGTSWLDVGNRKWSDDLLAACDLGPEHMPKLVEGTDASGGLRAELCQRWGIAGSVVVAGGAGDNAASAVAVGAIKAGRGFLSLGTSGVLFAASNAYQPAPESAVHTFCHALPGRWHQMGVILAATDALNWFAKVPGVSSSELAGALGTELKAPGGALFLPYLGGERTPHNDASVRGAFLGLSHLADRDALTQAVLEGVIYGFRDCQEALTSTGTKLERLTAVGGGSQSDYWLKLAATVLDIPVERPTAGDFGGAFGAARLGLTAAEKADLETVCTVPPKTECFDPEPQLKGAFEDAYARFRSAYLAIRSL